MNRQGDPRALLRSGVELVRRIDLHPSLLSGVEYGRIDAWPPRFRPATATALGVDEALIFRDPRR